MKLKEQIRKELKQIIKDRAFDLETIDTWIVQAQLDYLEHIKKRGKLSMWEYRDLKEELQEGEGDG